MILKKRNIWYLWKKWIWKSTLLNLITGLLKANSGEIKVNSKIYQKILNIYDLNGYVPQFVYLFDDTKII